MRNIRQIGLLGLLLSVAGGCSEQGVTAPQPIQRIVAPTSISITPSNNMVTAASVLLAGATGEARIEYQSVDLKDTVQTPWGAADKGLAVLGLRGGQTYRLHITLRGVAEGDTLARDTVYTTPPYPDVVAQMHTEVLSGRPLSGGYILTSALGADGHSYMVAFDGQGLVRWYRDMGIGPLEEIKQQPTGTFTAYRGGSRGWDLIPGAYVEVSPLGDSLRSWSAGAGEFTDGHELWLRNEEGHVAAYLSGYTPGIFDRSTVGGGLDTIAMHQILRLRSNLAPDPYQVQATGPIGVDTLLNGWNYWKASDFIEPPQNLGDLDHPNAITFDGAGNPIVSFRNLGAIVKLDKAGGGVLWQLGGDRSDFKIVGDPWGFFSAQHCVRMLANGHILVFDNGWRHTPQRSRVVEYALDEARRTATFVWQYVPSPDIFTAYTGSVARLANGNTLIGWASESLVDEVDAQGQLVSRIRPYATQRGGASFYRVTPVASLYPQ